MEDESQKYQKLNAYVKFLPYYDDIGREADRQLSDIKAGLAYSILWREQRPALIHWACELDRYVHLYGFRFCKDDHVLFVKTMYELMVMPGMELRLVKTFSLILNNLLKKISLLSRQDLVLPWRPLYDLYYFIAYKSLEEDGLFLLPNDLCKSIENLIARVRTYFPKESTAEILAEFRPLMCIWDASYLRAWNCLKLFLPTRFTKPEEHEDHGSKLWMDELCWAIFETKNEPPWTPSCYDLLSRLVWDNVGYVDLESRMEEIFFKILRSFKLTVTDKVSGGDTIEIGFNGKTVEFRILSQLLVGCMGNGSSVQKYLDKLLLACDSYLHPSNNGSWQGNILDFMQHLAYQLCRRLHNERYRKPDWTTPVPENYKITDEEIKHFVESMLPLALNGMFTKTRSDVAVSCIRYLAMMCPEIVLPAVLDRVYAALNTLVEPHRLIQSFRTLSCVVVNLVRDKNRANLRQHVVRLMDGVLPGMDPNDVVKSMLTLQILSLFTLLVPVVDCSSAIDCVKDLTTEESELCSSTAMFENYVNLYMDKVFAIIETFSGSGGAAGAISRRRGSSVKFNAEENSIKGGLYASFRSLLGNCSTEIYDIVVNRLYNFLSSNILEGKITAEIMGELCFSAVRTNPRRSFGKFLSLFIKRISAIIEDEHFNPKDEDLNIVWYLTMLTQIVRCEGTVLVSFKPELLKLTNLLRPLTSKEIYTKFSTMLENICISLSFIYICDYESNRRNIDSDMNDYLPIRHWGESCELKDYKPNWHVPNQQEVEFLDEILKLYVLDELTRLEKPEILKKEEIHKALRFISCCLSGSSCLLPLLDGQVLPPIQSHVPLAKFSYPIAPSTVPDLSFDGKNIRNYVYEKLHHLIEFLMGERADETKCLPLICTIFYNILFLRGLTKAKYDNQIRALGYTKTYALDTITGKKSSPTCLLGEYVIIEHHKRLVERNFHVLTDTHLAVIRDILKLSTSKYSEVRKSGQIVFDAFTSVFTFSYRFVLDEILALLENKPEITHEQFKGALYLLIGSSARRSLLVRHHWKTLIKIWPLVIRAQHSEKPSIIQLLDSIQNLVVENLQSFQIKLNFNETCTNIVKEFWNRGSKPTLPILEDEKLKLAVKEEEERNLQHEKEYYELVKQLTILAKDSTLHWRHMDMAQSFLSLLIRYDMKFPKESVQLFVRLLINDSVKTRRISVALLAAILKTNRPKYKISNELKTEELFAKLNLSNNPLISNKITDYKRQVKWGLRKDNEFLIYDQEKTPRTKEEWEKCFFVEKTHIGFYCWPEKVKLSPSFKKDDLDYENLKTDEMGLLEAFKDQNFVEKFSALMSVESEKEESNSEEQFNATVYMFFQNVCRTFGPQSIEHFKPIMEKFVKSTKLSEQRFASEFVCGSISGAKMWPFEICERFWSKFMTPLLRTAFENLTNKNANDWGVCLATIFDSRDPKKLFWFLDLLMEMAKKPVDSSFNAASRLFLLQGALHQQEWRVLPLWHDVLAIVQPLLSQPYQNLRDRLGSVLATVFSCDIENMTCESSKYKSPNKKTFLKQIHGRLEILYKEVELGHPSDASAALYSNGDSAERQDAILLLKTMLCFLNTQWAMWFSLPDELLDFLPLLCYFENETSDDELKRDCRAQLMRGLARSWLTPASIDRVLDNCEKVSVNKWWKCRVSCLRFLQVNLFSNLYYYSDGSKIKRVEKIIKDLLHDVQLDVREAASSTLSSLLHCGYWKINEEFLSILNQWTQKQNSEIMRHAGVLGMCAVIRSCPYTVPEFLPSILMSLCSHASTSAGHLVSRTAKKCLSEFKRTHQDSWHEHKEKFTEDQLCTLDDVLVSPNYYI